MSEYESPSPEWWEQYHEWWGKFMSEKVKDMKKKDPSFGAHNSTRFLAAMDAIAKLPAVKGPNQIDWDAELKELPRDE